MRKTWSCIILVLALLPGALTGCGAGAATQREMPTTQASSLPTEPSSSVVAEAADTSLPQTVPEYTAAPLIAAAPDRAFYLTLANQDRDFYPETYYVGAHFYVLTKQPYSADQLRVSFPMQTPYQVDVTDETERLRMKQCDGGGFADYHCLSLLGVDWQDLGQQALNALNAGMEAMHYNAGEEKFWELEAVGEEYRKVWAQCQQRFLEMPVTDIPECYAYAVSVLFTGLTEVPTQCFDEIVETLELTLGDDIYTVHFGQWRFHTALPETLKADNAGLAQQQCALLSITDSPYNGGYVRLQDALSFKAAKNMTVTGVRTYGTDVNLTVTNESFVTIVGKSGSGKSTLLHILGLVEGYDGGEYLFNGTKIRNYTDYSRLRLENIGFIFQSYNLIPTLSCKENILLPTLYNRKNKVQDFDELVELLDIAPLLSQRVTTLSSGEKQRVAIARALILDP